MTGWLIAGVILFLLAILPLGVRLSYNEQGFVMKILVGPFRIPFSVPKTEKSPDKAAERKRKTQGRDPERRKLEGFPAARLRGAGFSWGPAAKAAVRPYQHPCGPGRGGPGGSGHPVWKNLGGSGRTLASAGASFRHPAEKCGNYLRLCRLGDVGGCRRRRDPDLWPGCFFGGSVWGSGFAGIFENQKI